MSLPVLAEKVKVVAFSFSRHKTDAGFPVVGGHCTADCTSGFLVCRCEVWRNIRYVAILSATLLSQSFASNNTKTYLTQQHMV